MEYFHRAMAVRLKSSHGKYLIADEDEESVVQSRRGSARSARWTVEFVHNSDDIIRLKSCYGKYLTASNQPVLLTFSGWKVMQTIPKRLDSSVEWEPVRGDGGDGVRLKTRYGQFLKANWGLAPPWRNSVTHDVMHRTATHDWITWEVDVVEILPSVSPAAKPPPPPLQTLVMDSAVVSGPPASAGNHLKYFRNSPPRALVVEKQVYAAVEAGSPAWSDSSTTSSRLSRQESHDSLVPSPSDSRSRCNDGRLVYFHLADENGGVDDEDYEDPWILFKGNSVKELAVLLEKELGVDGGVTVCGRNPLDGRLYPLRLQLPPSNVTMHVIVVPPSMELESV